MSLHTKGPWEIGKELANGHCAINGHEWDELARVVIRMKGDDELLPEGVANAELICKAPTMFAALEEIHRRINNPKPGDGMLQLVEIDQIVTQALSGVAPEPQQPLSLRGQDWQAFSAQVLAHIEGYTVPQYGDRGGDLASEYSPTDCVAQVKKYLARHGRNQRPGQDRLDLLKAAHYLQMAAMTLEEGV